jgi:hypothetical protein
LWTAARNVDGYGSLGGILAHRIAWELASGSKIPTGACVLHRCDNPPCVNPDHLFLGSQADNVKDCVAKGRQARTRGAISGRARLDDESVRVIRQRAAQGATQAALAKDYDVDPSAISRAIGGQRWRHV